MKKTLSIILAFITAFSLVTIAYSADKVTPEGISYSVDNGYATIKGYSGSKKELVIPPEIDGAVVNEIDYGAFENNNIIEKVTIPGSVTLVDINAFKDCPALKTVVFIPGENVTIANTAFNGCGNLESINLGEANIVSIGNLAFEDCVSLTEITIPDSCTELKGSRQFKECSGLRKATIGKNIKSLDSTFWKCTSLQEVVFAEGSSLQQIYSETFAYCSSLRVLTIPSTVTEIRSFPEGIRTITFEKENDGVVLKISGCTEYTTKELTNINCPNVTKDEWLSLVDVANASTSYFTPDNSNLHFRFKGDSPVTYTLSYNPNGGTGAPAAQFGSGSISLSNVKPTKSGCTFLGWSKDTSSVNTLYQPGSSFNLSGDTTLYAMWESDSNVTKTVRIGKGRTVDYRSKLIFSADSDRLAAGENIHWFINDRSVGSGSNYTVNEAKESFTIQAKIIGSDGKVAGESSTETITVKSGIIDKIFAFILGLFGFLPTVKINP